MKRLAVLFSQKFYKSTKLESFNRQETRNKKQLQIKSCKLLSRDKSKTTNQIVICFLHNSARDKGSILLFVNASISRLIKAIHGFVWIRHVTNVGRGSCVDEYSFFFRHSVYRSLFGTNIFHRSGPSTMPQMPSSFAYRPVASFNK